MAYCWNLLYAYCSCRRSTTCHSPNAMVVFWYHTDYFVTGSMSSKGFVIRLAWFVPWNLIEIAWTPATMQTITTTKFRIAIVNLGGAKHRRTWISLIRLCCCCCHCGFDAWPWRRLFLLWILLLLPLLLWSCWNRRHFWEMVNWKKLKIGGLEEMSNGSKFINGFTKVCGMWFFGTCLIEFAVKVSMAKCNKKVNWHANVIYIWPLCS